MSLFGNFVFAGLLISLLSAGVLSESSDTCLVYRVESNKNIVLSDKECTKNLMKINFNALIKSEKSMKNTYSLHIREPEVYIDREHNDQRIDLNRCPSNIIPARRCQLPTLIVLDDDGLLKEIRVDENEPEVCVNVKLYAISLLQINKNQLKDMNKMEKSPKDELFFIGKCPVSYKVIDDKDKKEENLHIIKNVQLDQCSGVQKIGERENLKASAVLNIEAVKIKDTLIPQVILYNATFDYMTGVHSTGKTRINADIKVTLTDTVSCAAVPSFIDDKAVSVTSQHLRPVDENLLNNWKSGNDDLTKIYRALASDGIATNIYQDLYERTLKCWELI